MNPHPIVVALGAKALPLVVGGAMTPFVELAGRGPLVLVHGDRSQAGPLERELRNALPGREVATLLTQVVVAPAGPGLTEPQRLLELGSVRVLLAAGVVVVCADSGTPVALGDRLELRGVDASVEPDLVGAALAVALDARAFLLLTDVPAVMDGWETAEPRPIARATPAELRARPLAAGSIGPKAEAAARFAERTGRPAAIGTPAEAALLLDGVHGTTVLDR